MGNMKLTIIADISVDNSDGSQDALLTSESSPTTRLISGSSDSPWARAVPRAAHERHRLAS